VIYLRHVTSHLNVTMIGDGSSNLNLRAWDVHDEFNGVGNIIIGVIEIIAGLLSIALGIGAICTFSSGYFIGYGIWCGFIFTLAGAFAIAAACRKTTCLIITNMSLSILSACCGAVQLSLGIVAANSDRTIARYSSSSGVQTYYNPWDIYYSKNTVNQYLCAGNNASKGWTDAWGPVDVLLLIVGFIDAVVAVAAAITCCQVVCCGLRRVSGSGIYFHGGNIGTGTTGYSNDGYMTDPRMSPSPPLYKVM